MLNNVGEPFLNLWATWDCWGDALDIDYRGNDQSFNAFRSALMFKYRGYIVLFSIVVSNWVTRIVEFHWY